MKNNYNIIEIANTHGGSLDYLNDLVKAFEDYTGNFGMKFQPFSPATIATPDYEWYTVYEQITFSKAQWSDIIAEASKTKDIWLDLFDVFGVDIFKENQGRITGIKFQSSVLYNLEVFAALQQCNLADKKIILNIAAQNLDDIKKIIENVQNKLDPDEILLEFGYQAYPTTFEDSGISKIKVLRKHFKNRLVFADHVDGKSQDAITLPAMASLLGVEVIEKHVMLGGRETKYDYFSSLTPELYQKMLIEQKRYIDLLENPFINTAEIQYLRNSIMIPVLKNDLSGGKGINFEKDFIFRRSGQKGLNTKEISHYKDNFYILAHDKKAGQALQKLDFKKANIATIIACRLKSSRLKRKALLEIGDMTSVEFCIANALKFENINQTILATSDNEEDSGLINHTLNESVIFHQGDPEDVIRRYLDIADKLRIDVIIRVTGDMPFIDDEICQLLLKEHFVSGADYTTARKAAVGTNLEIINVQALMVVKDFFPNAMYSEYMTWYFQNNPDYFNLHFVDLPEELIRDYRLTLDYPEDLEMFNKIHTAMEKQYGANYSIRNVFHYLDNNPKIAEINNHLTLKYKTDQNLIDILNKETRINIR